MMDSERKNGGSDQSALAQASADSLAQQVKRANELINSRAAIDEGVRLMIDAARRGNEEAAYTLAWLHMQGTGVPRDNDKALEYLKTIRSEFRTPALILKGAVYAEGSNSMPADKSKAQQIFNEAALALEAELKQFQQREPTHVDDVLRRQRWQENWSVLRGMAEKYGLVVTRPAKP